MVVGARAAQVALRTSVERERRVLVCFNVEDALNLIALLRYGDRELLVRLKSVCGDTFAGRLILWVFGAIGHPALLYRFNDGAAAIHDLRKVIREEAPIVMSVDGRSAHGDGYSGIIKILRSRGGVLLPIAARASRGVRLPGRTRMRIPLPSSRIAVAVGPALRAEGNPAELEVRLRCGLGIARSSAEAFLLGRPAS